MTEALVQFRDAIRSTGLEPPDAIKPGKVHRFPGAGKGPSNRAGWCLLFHDGLGGCFGDWSSGLSHTWFSRQGWPCLPHAQVGLSRQIQAARLQTKRSRRERYAEAVSRARRI